MLALPRIVSMLLGITLATPVALPRLAHAQPTDAPGEEATEATRLNAEAQQKYADGDYAGSAQTYARILEVLPENRVNREERDNVLLLVIGVYQDAYKQATVVGDKDAIRRAAEMLCVAEKHYKAYVSTYRDVYGGGADPSKAARESNDTLQAKLKEAEAELGSSPCAPPPPKVEPKKEDPPAFTFEGPEPPRGPSGVGLIVAGAITLTAGVGATSMIIVGGINRRKAKDIRDDEESTDAERSNAKDNIKRADGLIIAGSVVSGVLIAGGAAMLGIGIRRRMRYMAFAPTFNRGYVGLSLQGRF